jgi:hypothetical protein
MWHAQQSENLLVLPQGQGFDLDFMVLVGLTLYLNLYIVRIGA